MGLSDEKELVAVGFIVAVFETTAELGIPKNAWTLSLLGISACAVKDGATGIDMLVELALILVPGAIEVLDGKQ